MADEEQPAIISVREVVVNTVSFFIPSDAELTASEVV